MSVELIDTITNIVEDKIDLYDILLLTRDTWNIKKAKQNSRTLLKKYHPDKASSKNKSYDQSKVTEVLLAGKILFDEKLKFIYDQKWSEMDESVEDQDCHAYMKNNYVPTILPGATPEERDKIMADLDKAMLLQDAETVNEKIGGDKKLDYLDPTKHKYNSHVEVSDKVKELQKRQLEISKIEDPKERQKQFNEFFKQQTKTLEEPPCDEVSIYNGNAKARESHMALTSNYNTMFAQCDDYDSAFGVNDVDENDFDDRPIEELMKEYNESTEKLNTLAKQSKLASNGRADYKFDWDS